MKIHRIFLQSNSNTSPTQRWDREHSAVLLIHVAPSTRRPSAQLLLSAPISDTLRPQRHRQLLRLITFKLKLLDIFRHGHPVWLGLVASTCHIMHSTWRLSRVA